MSRGWAALAVCLLVVAAALPACGGRSRPVPAPEAPTGAGPAEADWLARAGSPAFTAHAAGRVSLEYPEDGWQIVPDDEAALATFAHDDGEAIVTLEESALQQALAPDEVTEVFGQLEAETIREREPDASDFDVRLMVAGERRVVGVQYRRPGPDGPEVVRQYSFPVGATLYRLTCVMRPDVVPEQERVCAHMAASFTAAGM